MSNLIPTIVLEGRRAAHRDKFDPRHARNPYPMSGPLTLSPARQSWNYGWNDEASQQPQTTSTAANPHGQPDHA